MKYFIQFTIFIFSFQSIASQVAVVDSGTDFEHSLLQGKQWINSAEVQDNLIDDDRNGKVDDANGWNFVENYEKIFFREHLSKINPIVFKLFDVISRIQSGTATAEDKAFWEANVTSLSVAQKQALFQHLNFYGQYSHGTHCSGVVAQQNPNTKIMSARVFPDDPATAYQHPKGISDFFYGLLARLSNTVFSQVATYLNSNKIDVANYSLGVPLKALAQQFLALRGINNPTDEQLAEETVKLFRKYEVQGKTWMGSSPQTLFVIAAGNDGTDNDQFPTFPSNVRIANAISVAATNGYSSLAAFSNYGKLSVDVAAPGVAILSSVPSLDNQMYLPLSGTSMAAPYVTGVASRIKDINPALSPSQIKEILMGTVDRKEWLIGKVVSGGLINSERAYIAAEKAKTMDISKAIGLALRLVIDRSEPVKNTNFHPQLSAEMKEWSKKLVF
jgi:cell wall-associated protease